MSKDLKPKQRLGQAGQSPIKKAIGWIVTLGVCGGAAFAAYRYVGKTTVEVAAQMVKKADFSITVKTRGELKSTNSKILSSPQVPSLKIVKLAESGKFVKAGDIVVKFDEAVIDQQLSTFETTVITTEARATSTKAGHKMRDDSDAMSKMQAEYNLKRAELAASKATVVSEIEGAKSKIDVGIREGELGLVGASINSNKVTQSADLLRLQQSKDKTLRDRDRYKEYLSKMEIRAPQDGIVNILPNYRAQGSGNNYPPYKEGDSVFTGMAIAEIPDLEKMRIELRLDEVDRGRVQLGLPVKIRVDALPEKELEATLDWISPIAQILSRGGTVEKWFPAYATLKTIDGRLRPGMSATAQVMLEAQPSALLIPVRANFTKNGKPAVWVKTGDRFELRNIESW
jgi:multidrug efflux pump subunit AcrA (membrane-fusion protein)